MANKVDSSSSLATAIAVSHSTHTTTPVYNTTSGSSIPLHLNLLNPPPNASLININSNVQIPLKLTLSNYFSWHTQWKSLLRMYGFMRFVDTEPTAAHFSSDFWSRQDQLVCSALIGSLSPEIIPFVISADTSFVIWQYLYKTYAKPSRTRLMSLRESLAKASKGMHSITLYLQYIKHLCDQLVFRSIFSSNRQHNFHSQQSGGRSNNSQPQKNCNNNGNQSSLQHQ